MRQKHCTMESSLWKKARTRTNFDWRDFNGELAIDYFHRPPCPLENGVDCNFFFIVQMGSRPVFPSAYASFLGNGSQWIHVEVHQIQFCTVEPCQRRGDLKAAVSSAQEMVIE
mmetsp:Transcript_7217/g.27025  ORF Transcript_7217/g.27025 Transcript_7217/m.27025 type:complete len:113 (+) Transcript_7217:321-659(+)